MRGNYRGTADKLFVSTQRCSRNVNNIDDLLDTGAFAEDVFEKLCAFGSYSFPKSYATTFVGLVYQSAWLKCNPPVALYIAILNNQPMGFWTPAIIVNRGSSEDEDGFLNIIARPKRILHESKLLRPASGCGEYFAFTSN